MRTWVLVATVLFCLVPRIAGSQPASLAPDDWKRVDTLRPGARVAVTLDGDERRSGRFRAATIDEVTLAVGRRTGDPSEIVEARLPKSRIAKLALEDPATEGMQWGALVGGFATASLFQTSANACGIGCENGIGGMAWLVGAFGAGIGTAVGYLVDRFDDRSEILYPPSAASAVPRSARTSRFFPARPSLRIGSSYSVTRLHAASVHGSAAAAPGFAIAGQVAPWVSLHAEYTAVDALFTATPGSVPDSVLQNLVSASARVAGRDHWIESRRLRSVYTELVGIHPPPWGRLRLQVLAGVSVRGQEDRNYYDAWRQLGQGTMSDPSRVERIPGKYYVLNFESPEAGAVYGVDAEIATLGGLLVVPTFRYTRTRNPGPTSTLGVGAHWRF